MRGKAAAFIADDNATSQRRISLLFEILICEPFLCTVTNLTKLI